MRIRESLLLLLLVVLGFGQLVGAQAATSSCVSALLVIDVQNEWASDPEWHTTVDGTYIVDKVVALLDLARSAGVPVIYIRDISRRGDLDESQLAFPEAIAPQEGEPIVEKKMPDAFAFTDLQAQLNELGVTQVLVCGLASQGCVDATLFGAIRRRIDAIAIEDGHTGLSGGTRAQESNEYWRSRGANVVPSTELDWDTLCDPVPDDEA